MRARLPGRGVGVIDIDHHLQRGDGLRVVQLTPQQSPCSVIFGKGITAAAPGSTQGLMLVVTDIDVVRAELIERGIDVSEVFHDVGGIFHHAGANGRTPGRDPLGRSYYTWASFNDPDGNGWLLQEVKTRLPGRTWPADRESSDLPHRKREAVVVPRIREESLHRETRAGELFPHLRGRELHADFRPGGHEHVHGESDAGHARTKPYRQTGAKQLAVRLTAIGLALRNKLQRSMVLGRMGSLKHLV